MCICTAPWCGHCKQLAPIWERFADDIAMDEKLSATVQVAQVDCDVSRLLCERHKVQGFPTIIHFDAESPPVGVLYEGDHTSVAKLLNNAQTLGPQCSHKYMNLCDTAQRATLDEYLELTATERKELVAKTDADIKKILKDFNDAIPALNAAMEKAQTERDAAVAYHHDKEFGLLMSIVRSDADSFGGLYPDESLENP